MQVHLSSGNYHIIASGESFLFGPHEDLTIRIDDENVFQVTLIMKFTEDSSGEHHIKTDIENDALIITCVNFNSMGLGLKRPAYVANANGKKIYLMFLSSFLDNKEEQMRSVKYTVFCEK